MLFIDSSNVEEIRTLWQWGCFSGVTTNPIIMKRDGAGDIHARVREILKVSEGPVSVQMTTPLAEKGDIGTLLDEAETYSNLNSRVVIKVPTGGDVEQYAIAELLRNHHDVNVTCCMTSLQAYMAAAAGAPYVSLFWCRIRDFQDSPYYAVRQTRAFIERDRLGSKIIVGSIRKPTDVLDALDCGADIVTVPPKILREMLVHPKTTETVAEMRAAAKG